MSGSGPFSALLVILEWCRRLPPDQVSDFLRVLLAAHDAWWHAPRVD